MSNESTPDNVGFVYRKDGLNNSKFQLFFWLKIFLTPLVLAIGFILWYLTTQTAVITVVGEGRAYATPEVAKFALNISAIGNTSQDALNSAKLKFNAIKEQLKSNGILEEDITTSTFSVTSAVTGQAVDISALNLGQRAQVVVGVDSRYPEKVEELIASVLTNGVSLLSSPVYTTNNPEELEAQAREKAIQNAREKAEAIAKKFGRRLGKMISYNDTSTTSQTGTPLTKQTMDVQTGQSANQAEILRFVQVSFRSY